MELESAVVLNAAQFHLKLVGPSETFKRLQIGNLAGEDDDEDPRDGFSEILARQLFGAEIRNGKRLFALWEESGWEGLRRDEPFIASLMKDVRPGVLEIRTRLGKTKYQCVDLLEPGRAPFVLHGGLLPSLEQFTGILGWIYDSPFFTRIILEPFFLYPNFAPLESILERAAEAIGAPCKPGSPGFPSWLTTRTPEMQAALSVEFAKAAARSETVELVETFGIRGRQDEVLKGLRGSEECRELGRAGGFFEFEWDAGPEWAEEVGSEACELLFPDRPLARFRVSNDTLEIRGKGLTLMGMAVSFFAREVGDLLDPTLASAPGVLHLNRLAPAGHLVATNIAAIPDLDERALSEALLDFPTPFLNGHTPRQAAKNPALLRTLRGFVKSCLNAADEASELAGRRIDLSPLAHALGLDDLAIPLPPIEHKQVSWWRELSIEEAHERMVRVLERKGPEDIQDWVTGISDFVDRIPSELLDDRGRRTFWTYCVLAAQCAAPEGVRFDLDDSLALTIAFRANMAQLQTLLQQGLRMPDAMERLVARFPQRELIELLGGLFARAFKENFRDEDGPHAAELLAPLICAIAATLQCLRNSSG